MYVCTINAVVVLPVNGVERNFSGLSDLPSIKYDIDADIIAALTFLCQNRRLLLDTSTASPCELLKELSHILCTCGLYI